MQPKTAGRLQSMDVLKAVAIFLVLWGHAQHLTSINCFDRPVYYHIYTFHMPLFMMISGFFFAMTVRTSFTGMLRRKARQLLLPCAVCLCIIWLFDGIIFGDELTFKHLIYRLTHHIWFLKSAFICCLLGFIPFAAMKNRLAVAAIATLAASQFIRTHQTAFMYPAFLAGGLIYLNHDSFRAHCRIIFAVGALLCIAGNLFMDGETYRWLLSRPQTTGEIIAMRLYKYTMGLSGAIALTALAEWIFSHPRSGPAVEAAAKLGGMTLGIYLLQTFILEDILTRLVRLDMFPAWIFDFIVSPAIALAVMYASVAAIRLIRRSTVASLLLLGIKK